MKMTFGERGALAVGIGLVMLNRGALRVGLRPRVDGWRRAAGLVLRGKESTFVLSAFGLNAPTGGRAGLASRLHEFLKDEPAMRACVRAGPEEDRIELREGPEYTIRVESAIAGPARFVRPDDWSGERAAHHTETGDAQPLMNVVCREAGDGRADIWLRVNHVGTDGVPVQDMLTRFERVLGGSESVVFPSPDEFRGLEGPRACAGRSGIAEVQCFLDFEPLLAWRKKQNARLSEAMTISAAIIWWLGHSGALDRIHIGTTVEVAPSEGLAAGVGVVVVRPADYFACAGGLAQYVKDFNHQVARTRRRESASCRVLDAAAHVSPRLAKGVLRFALRQGTRAFGSLGLTMLKDARVFGAPIGEVGHDDGFVAIGSVGLPTATGGRAGCVTIKGPRERIAEYPRVIREAIEACGV